MATTKYGSTWTGTYSGAANRYFRAYCTYTTSETDTTFTLSVSALGIQKTSGGQCEMVSGASKTAKLTASGASVKSGSPISKSSTALISWETGSQYKSLGSGSIVFNKTETAQTATLTLYADKSGGDTSTAWGGKSTGTFTITIPAITRTISFDANEGSGAPSAVKGKHGSTITLPTLKPTRTGYDFLGWATSSSATSAEYLSGGSYVVSGDITLYAIWHVSFVAPKIEQLKAYRTESASSNVASATGTYGYVSFAYTAPVEAQSVAIAVRFSTDTANKTISSPTTSGTKSAWGNSQINGTSSATITVTVSGKTYTGTDFSISAQTYISPEVNVWDAYIDGEIASFAIGGQASETESRHDVNIPAYFNNTADFNGDVLANKMIDYGFATADIVKLINHLGAGYKWHENVNDSEGTFEIVIDSIKVVFGHSNITPSKALTSTYKTVNLGCTFDGNVNVVLSLFGAPQIATLILSVSANTSTDFTAHIYASNTTTRGFKFIAIGKAPVDERTKNIT